MIIWALDRLKMLDAERSAVLAETLEILRAADIDMIELSYLQSRLGKKLVPLPWAAEEQTDAPGDEVVD